MSSKLVNHKWTGLLALTVIVGLGAFYVVVVRYDVAIPFISERGIYRAPLVEKVRSVFSISTSGNELAFTEAQITPVKVSVGDTQELSITIKDPSGIVSVLASTELDSRTFNLPLAPVGESKEGCTECTWKGSWVVNDTVDKTYRTKFTATNTKGNERSIVLAWSDPCSPPYGGDWTLSTSCSISSVTGLDIGTLTISNGETLTIQAGGVWAFKQGRSIKLGSGGMIVIEQGGMLRRTLLWIKDADSDTYPSSPNDQLAQDSAPTNYIRRNTANATSDCYDSNASANPTQTSYFTTNRGDGSFDYNCDSAQSKLWTTTSSCTTCGKSTCSTAGAWSGGAPACGVSGTYFVNSSCGTGSRTQQCR